MGTLFAPPSPPPPIQVPKLPAPADPDAAEREQRLAAVERLRRGRRATVKTSARGLLATNDTTPGRKTLLGE